MPSKGKIMDKRMRSRWSPHCQRLGVAIPMWHVLSFTGRFDDEFFKDVEALPTQEGERSAEQQEPQQRSLGSTAFVLAGDDLDASREAAACGERKIAGRGHNLKDSACREQEGTGGPLSSPALNVDQGTERRKSLPRCRPT